MLTSEVIKSDLKNNHLAAITKTEPESLIQLVVQSVSQI